MEQLLPTFPASNCNCHYGMVDPVNGSKIWIDCKSFHLLWSTVIRNLQCIMNAHSGSPKSLQVLN